MINIKKTNSNILRKKLQKISHLENGSMKFYEKASKFCALAFEIRTELDKRNRAAIFKTACKVLKNHKLNQFYAAAQYADAVINSSNYFSGDYHHEIGSFYTKSKHPEIVYF